MRSIKRFATVYWTGHSTMVCPPCSGRSCAGQGRAGLVPAIVPTKVTSLIGERLEATAVFQKLCPLLAR